MSKIQVYKSSYFLRFWSGDLNPFTPNIISISDDYIQFKRRNWYLISHDTETLHYQNVTGVSVDKHILSATITIKSSGNDPIYVKGFWKGTASKIQKLCTEKINQSQHAGTSKAVADAMSKVQTTNIADELRELKKLVDEGIITEEEFQQRKKKVLDS